MQVVKESKTVVHNRMYCSSYPWYFKKAKAKGIFYSLESKYLVHQTTPVKFPSLVLELVHLVSSSQRECNTLCSRSHLYNFSVSFDHLPITAGGQRQCQQPLSTNVICYTLLLCTMRYQFVWLENLK